MDHFLAKWVVNLSCCGILGQEMRSNSVFNMWCYVNYGWHLNLVGLLFRHSGLLMMSLTLLYTTQHFFSLCGFGKLHSRLLPGWVLMLSSFLQKASQFKAQRMLRRAPMIKPLLPANGVTPWPVLGHLWVVSSPAVGLVIRLCGAGATLLVSILCAPLQIYPLLEVHMCGRQKMLKWVPFIWDVI
jgi:1,4-dihydroxy-2-naphthoate octaprenyltransferase